MVRKNFTAGYQERLLKKNSRKQTIKDFLIKLRDVTKENFAEPEIEEELSLEEETALRKILFDNKLISHEMDEETV